MAGRVEQDVPPLRPGLELGDLGTQLEAGLFGAGQVVHLQVEVVTLGGGGARPGGWLVALDAAEADGRCRPR